MEGEWKMIDIKPPQEEIESEPTDVIEKALKKLNPNTYYLKEISRTLNEILREMRKRG